MMMMRYRDTNKITPIEKIRNSLAILHLGGRVFIEDKHAPSIGQLHRYHYEGEHTGSGVEGGHLLRKYTLIISLCVVLFTYCIVLLVCIIHNILLIYLIKTYI